jgi:hypothetical protein
MHCFFGKRRFDELSCRFTVHLIYSKKALLVIQQFEENLLAFVKIIYQICATRLVRVRVIYYRRVLMNVKANLDSAWKGLAAEHSS